MQVESGLWSRCVRALEDELPGEHFNTWVRPLQAVESNGALKLLAPNRFAVDWVNAHLLSRLGEIVRRFVEGDAPIVTVEVGSRAPDQVRIAEPDTNGVARPKRSEGIVVGVRLNPDFTFNGFVEGKSNQLAKAAAVQVAENPGRAYNPLFIYGGVGLGKTHLMQAVGHTIKARDPDARIAYIHSERFVSDMVIALQHNKMNEFKTAYRSLDALLIDDIQFFANKDRSQEEFFHTFNALLEGSAAGDRHRRSLSEGSVGSRRTLEIPLRMGTDGRHRTTGARDLRGDPHRQGAGRQRAVAGRGRVLHRETHSLERPRARRRAEARRSRTRASPVVRSRSNSRRTR